MKNSRKKVLIAAPVHKVLTEGLEELGYECVVSEKINQAAAYDLIGACVGVVTSTRLQLDRSLIDVAPMLQWIGRMGSGMEVIDLDYAATKNIRCFGSPEGNCNAVGEHALGMLLSLIRRITWSHNEMRSGIWKRDENRGIELEGKTIGIIGFGHTGHSFARKLSGFDTKILAYDKYSINDVPDGVANCASLEPIFDNADIISFHVPLHSDTIGYFNEAFLSRMRKPFILINTSRGPVVEFATLNNGIKSGQIVGACLDVFETEPLGSMNDIDRNMLGELTNTDKVIVTPHIAGYTFEALYKMSKTLLNKITDNTI